MIDRKGSPIAIASLPVTKVLGDDAGWGDGKIELCCPVCSSTYQHMESPQMSEGHDAHKANWSGRGDLVKIPFSGECGHQWFLCLGFHKGDTLIFVEQPDQDDNREGSKPIS